MTPPLTLALTSLMGMPSVSTAVHATNPTPPGSPSPVYSPPLVDSAVEQCAHKCYISSTLRRDTVRSEQEDENGVIRSLKRRPFLHHAGEAPFHTNQSPERAR